MSTPQARNSAAYDDRPACAGNSTCVPICPIQAKYDATVHVNKARLACVEIRDKAVVTAIELAGDRKTVGAVRYTDWNGDTHVVSARIVVLAAHSIESAKTAAAVRYRQFVGPGGPQSDGPSAGRRMHYPLTSDVADCFDSIYSHMLRMLQYVFDNSTCHDIVSTTFARCAIAAMTTVVKPLGEALARLPAGPEYEDRNAGPGLTLARHVALPTDKWAAALVAAERAEELSVLLDGLSASARDIGQLRSAADNLQELAQQLATLPAAARTDG